MLLLQGTNSSIYKKFKDAKTPEITQNDLNTLLLGAKQVFVTFSGIDKSRVDNIANEFKKFVNCEAMVYNNKELKSRGMIGIYYC